MEKINYNACKNTYIYTCTVYVYKNPTKYADMWVPNSFSYNQIISNVNILIVGQDDKTNLVSGE